MKIAKSRLVRPGSGRIDSSRRKFLRAGTAGAGAALGASMLSAINNGARADEGDPIPIGGGVPLTGWAAADGREFDRALRMACDEINELGGILGRPLEPHVEDH